MNIKSLAVFAAALLLLGQASLHAAGKNALPTGVIRAGSLCNKKLIFDTSVAATGKLAQMGYTYDVHRHTFQPYVVNMPKGAPGGRRWTEPAARPLAAKWWSLIAATAQNPMVSAKISGLYPDSGQWTVDGIRPFVDRALEVFGPERLMFGGDWPISVASGGYDRVFAGLQSALLGLDDEEANHIWSDTARRVYRIEPARLDAARGASLA